MSQWASTMPGTGFQEQCIILCTIIYPLDSSLIPQFFNVLSFLTYKMQIVVHTL